MPCADTDAKRRQAGSGQPVPSYTIYAALGDNTEYAVSDKQGHYRLAGSARKKFYGITAHPPEGSSWLEVGASVTNAENVPALKVDITVARGVVVTGRIIDKSMGKGVLGAVYFIALAGNKFIDELGKDFYLPQLNRSTDKEGRFRLVVVPGPCLLFAFAVRCPAGSHGERDRADPGPGRPIARGC